MNMRACWILAAALALTVPVSLAALAGGEETIKSRKELMKSVGTAFKQTRQMVNGEVDYDGAKASEAMAAIAKVASEFPAMFPDDSKEGGDTTAAPKIWEEKAEFDKLLVQLGADATAAASASGDQQDFNAAFGKLGGNCKGCHEKYRIEK